MAFIFDPNEGLFDDDLDEAEDMDMGPRRHHIKKRTPKQVAIGVGKQIFDVALATGTVLAMHFLPFSPFSFTAGGAILMGSAIFAGKKVLNTGYRFGKKHFIKARTKGEKKSVYMMKALEAAAVIIPLLTIGVSPITLAAGGIAGIAFARKNRRLFRKYYRDKKNAKAAKKIGG